MRLIWKKFRIARHRSRVGEKDVVVVVVVGWGSLVDWGMAFWCSAGVQELSEVVRLAWS